MLVRKIPIIAAVPAWAGPSALIAVPPCDAPQAVLNDNPPRGYAARRMFRQLSHQCRFCCLQDPSEHAPIDRDVTDPSKNLTTAL